MNAPNENPYQSPQFSEIEVSGLSLAPKGTFSWILVFLFNIPVPALFASGLVLSWGWLGVGLALASLLVLTIWLHAVSPKIMRTIWYGGIFTALTQLFPIPHMFAGMAAIEIARAMGIYVDPTDFGLGPGNIDSVLAGFAITFITGCILLLFAAVFGAIATLLVGKRRHAAPLEDQPTE
jgi:hypothetical protein